MLLGSQVRGRVDEALVAAACELISRPVVDRSRSVSFDLRRFPLLGVSKPLLAFVFVLLHEVLLVVSEVRLLGLELAHSFVECPRSLEVTRVSISELLSLFLQLPSFRFT